MAGVVGRPGRRPDTRPADRGYDRDKHRRPLGQPGIRPVIAERGQERGSGLDVFRNDGQRTTAWSYGFRCLRIRRERRDDIPEAFLYLAARPVTHRHVRCLHAGLRGGRKRNVRET